MNRERGQVLLSPIVEIAFNPSPLSVGGLNQLGARRPETRGILFSLRDDGRQTQCRECSHGDEELCGEDAAGDRVEDERADVVRGVPNGQGDSHRDGQGGSSLAEAECRPDRGREHQVRQRTMATECEESSRQPHECGEQEGGLRSASSGPVGPRRLGPGKRERHHDQGTGEVAEPPGAPNGRQSIWFDHIPQQKGQRTKRGADGRADDNRCEHASEVPETCKRQASVDEATDQERRHHDLEEVAERLAKRRPKRKR